MAPAEPSLPRRRLSWRKKLLFGLVPVTILALVAEWFARSFRHDLGASPFMAGSYRDQRIDLIRRGYPSAHDPVLGYVPRANHRSDDNRWRQMVTIDEHGLRSNGRPRPAGDREVLAVGDSFTFGDQVGDTDTWPSQLQERLQRPVRNGGVFGYSFGQAIQRAELLLDRFPIDTVVVSYIAEDLIRCELKRRYTPVPWFELRAGELVLCGVPVPDSDAGTVEDTQWVRKLLGYSAACDMLFWNTVPAWWVGQDRMVRAHPHHVGREIGKKLVERFAALARSRGIHWLLVLQGQRRVPEEDADAVAVLQQAASLQVPVLDLVARFHERQAREPGLGGKFFAGHMTAAGNAWVADEIAAQLRR